MVLRRHTWPTVFIYKEAELGSLFVCAIEKNHDLSGAFLIGLAWEAVYLPQNMNNIMAPVAIKYM